MTNDELITEIDRCMRAIEQGRSDAGKAASRLHGLTLDAGIGGPLAPPSTDECYERGRHALVSLARRHAEELRHES